MATLLRLTVVLGAIMAVVATARTVPTGAQGTPEATATPCSPVPAMNASPVAADGSFEMPVCGTVVIDSIVNNGPLAPEYQHGYEITIDTGGVAIIEIKEEGTPTPTTQTVDLGPDGLQELLGELQAIGFFAIGLEGTPIGEEPILVGGPVNTLAVWLGNEMWQFGEAQLSDEDLVVLNQAQQAVRNAVNGAPEATPEA